MKYFFKLALQYYLKYITKLVLFVHRPKVIVISGSTNKTFVKNEIKKVLLKKELSVRANPKNFNTEIGLPLAVLNLPSGYNSYKNWLPTIWQSFSSIFKTNFPDYLVLELGVSRRGDMKYLLSIVRPKISVITDITQRYIEGFSGMDDLVGEYRILAEKTDKKGLLIINGDNPRTRTLSKKNMAKTIFFGSSPNCDWIISEIKRGEKGEIFKVLHGNNAYPSEIDKFGLHNVYSHVVGMAIDKNLNIL